MVGRFIERAPLLGSRNLRFVDFGSFWVILGLLEDARLFLEIGCDPYTTQQISTIGWLYLHRHLG